MRHFFPVVLAVLALAFSALSSCNDPTAIGSDLLEGDEIDVDFVDTLTLEGHIERVDSVAVFSPVTGAGQYSSFLVGDYIDPVFGRVSSSVFAQITRNSSVPGFTSEGVVIDSVVLQLPYRKARSYGKLENTQTIEVYELAEELDDSTYLYSNQTFEVMASPIGSVSFVPDLTDSVLVHVPGTADSTIKTVPHLRIRLNDAFKDKLAAADSTDFLTGVEVKQFFKGFNLKPVFQGNNGGMVSFFLRDEVRLNNALLNEKDRFTGMKVYYHTADAVYKEYLFPITTSSIATTNFQHDYNGALVDAFFPVNGVANDSLFFIQAMNGINLILEVPYVQDLENLVVNKAELEFSILDLATDDPAYEPIDRLQIYEIVNDSTRTLIEDYRATENLTTFDQVYGGYPTADNKYRVNISAYFQDMMRGLASNKMLITVGSKPEKAYRVVLAGPGYHDPALRPRIKLSFSRF